jgi:hypothetical protein
MDAARAGLRIGDRAGIEQCLPERIDCAASSSIASVMITSASARPPLAMVFMMTVVGFQSISRFTPAAARSGTMT